jgi:tetratricopeptide (TPR) repeat protein
MQGDLKAAQEALAEVVESSARAGDRRIELRSRLELAAMRSYGDESAVSDLIDLAEEAIPVFESLDDDRSLGRAWLLAGNMKGHFRGEYGALEEAGRNAALHYRKAGWSPSTCLGAVGSALYYGPRPVPEAIDRCTRLLSEYVEDRASEASILLWLGGLQGMRGQSGEALALVDRAREMYLELGQRLAADETCTAVAGAVYVWMNRFEEAEDALRMSCETCLHLGESALLASRAAELGDVLYGQSQFEEADEWARLSHDRAADEDLDAQLLSRALMGKLEARRGGLAEAESLVRQAVQIGERMDGLNHKAHTLLDLSDVLRLAGRSDEALGATRAALALYELKGNSAAADQVRRLLATKAPVA